MQLRVTGERVAPPGYLHQSNNEIVERGGEKQHYQDNIQVDQVLRLALERYNQAYYRCQEKQVR